MPVDAVQFRVLTDIQVAIQGAITGGSLAGGLLTNHVIILKAATDRTLLATFGSSADLPGIAIAPLPEVLPETGSTALDEVTYNILVALVAADNQNQTANWEQELNWRQNVRRLFHAKQLGPLTLESRITWVKPLAVVDAGAWYGNLFLSMLIVAATCQEVRSQG